MSLDGNYDDDNIFNKILLGQTPCVKVYEDEFNLAFMDIFPEAEGHTLVIPKFKARNLFDISAALLAKHITTVQTIAQAINDAFKPDGLRIMQYNGAAATQTVFHLHFHIVPCFKSVALNEHGTHQTDQTKLQDHANKIIKKLNITQQSTY